MDHLRETSGSLPIFTPRGEKDQIKVTTYNVENLLPQDGVVKEEKDDAGLMDPTKLREKTGTYKPDETLHKKTLILEDNVLDPPEMKGTPNFSGDMQKVSDHRPVGVDLNKLFTEEWDKAGVKEKETPASTVAKLLEDIHANSDRMEPNTFYIFKGSSNGTVSVEKRPLDEPQEWARDNGPVFDKKPVRHEKMAIFDDGSSAPGEIKGTPNFSGSYVPFTIALGDFNEKQTPLDIENLPNSGGSQETKQTSDGEGLDVENLPTSDKKGLDVENLPVSGGEGLDVENLPISGGEGLDVENLPVSGGWNQVPGQRT